MPFLKIGEHVFQGAVAPLIGDEVIFDVERRECSLPSVGTSGADLWQRRMTLSVHTTVQRTRRRTVLNCTLSASPVAHSPSAHCNQSTRTSKCLTVAPSA